ncbi:exopolysaccharide biosynthesis protein [Legionella cincinnatiensis]|uniref:ABC transporter permease n=1 Tax=Legionella cincinnatiensis TaxID=28085 RepID=A0A378IJX5_9GAMM|nr:exopolysaccharide biosynthesis protein [Legionella cincinnatiensis]KTC83479.1 proton transporter [Legionella cincinnatiensis]STX35568.1 ABC transporter permease [Legionella cincinnatiensis]
MKISGRLKKLASKKTSKKITFNHLLNKFQQKDNLFLIILLAFFAITPISFIPGVTVLFGFSIALISAQILIGHNKIWLPMKLKNKQIPDDFNEGILKIVPYVVFLEKYIKKRALFFSSKWIKYLFIGFIFILSILLMIPIPYLDFITSFAIILISIGLIEKDGFLLIMAAFLIIIYVFILFYALNSSIIIIYKGFHWIKSL